MSVVYKFMHCRQEIEAEFKTFREAMIIAFAHFDNGDALVLEIRDGDKVYNHEDIIKHFDRCGWLDYY